MRSPGEFAEDRLPRFGQSARARRRRAGRSGNDLPRNWPVRRPQTRRRIHLGEHRPTPPRALHNEGERLQAARRLLAGRAAVLEHRPGPCANRLAGDCLRGGSKTYREPVRREWEVVPPLFEYRIVAGATGTGKTRLLQALAARGAHRPRTVGPPPRLSPRRGRAAAVAKSFASQLLAAFDRFVTSAPV